MTLQGIATTPDSFCAYESRLPPQHPSQVDPATRRRSRSVEVWIRKTLAPNLFDRASQQAERAARRRQRHNAWRKLVGLPPKPSLPPVQPAWQPRDRESIKQASMNLVAHRSETISIEPDVTVVKPRKVVIMDPIETTRS